jgi:hypothetical protein
MGAEEHHGTADINIDGPGEGTGCFGEAEVAATSIGMGAAPHHEAGIGEHVDVVRKEARRDLKSFAELSRRPVARH